jgi:glycosyltransferase involved in cell wall biosynthesis
MASYNGAEFIERQIFSILSQLGDYDELIISDDGSTDNTIQLVEKIGDPRINLISNKKRRGPMGNFENALNHSTGQLIFLADQDDIWLSGKVECVKSMLEKADLVLTNCEVIDKDGAVIQPSFFESRGSRTGFWHNLYRNSYVGCCMAFHRSVLSYALPIPAHVHMHDWWIGLLVEAKGSIALCPVPLIQYVRHGGNASLTGEKGYGVIRKIVNRFYMIRHIAVRLMSTLSNELK